MGDGRQPAGERWLGVVLLLIGVAVGIAAPRAAPLAALVFSFPYLLESVEALLGERRIRPQHAPAGPYIVVIPALLDNERAVLMRTVESWLATDADGVVVCANGNDAHLLGELEEWATRCSRLRVDHQPVSRSKAANLNRAFESIAHGTGDDRRVLCVDADVRPLGGYPRAGAATIVQGVRLIRRERRSVLEATVRCEYFLKSFVTYPARHRLFGIAYFGGSNAILDRAAATSVRFRETSVVEDVDFAVRTLLSGGTVAYDNTLRASEEAPPTWTSWAVQRHRWSSGWVGLAWRYSRAVVLSRRITGMQRLYWVYLLAFRKLVVPPAGMLVTAAAMATGRVGPWLAAMVLAPWLRFATCSRVAGRVGASCEADVRPTTTETAVAALLAPVYAAAGLVVDVAALAWPSRTWRPTARSTR